MISVTIAQLKIIERKNNRIIKNRRKKFIYIKQKNKKGIIILCICPRNSMITYDKYHVHTQMKVSIYIKYNKVS